MDTNDTTYDKTKFDYVKARRAVDLWVDNLNHPNVNWSWEIMLGCAEVYGNLGVNKFGTFKESLASIYHDFFDAWHNGSANFGIIGIMQEFAEACPEEHAEDQSRIMALAFAAGKSGKGVPKADCLCFSRTEGTKQRPLAPQAAARMEQKAKLASGGLSLIVDNTSTHSRGAK
jgi:hypothetical protein